MILGTAIAMAEEDAISEKPTKFRNLLPYLEMPDPIKAQLTFKLLDYLEAIKLDGFQEKKKRKVFILGNSGKMI